MVAHFNEVLIDGVYEIGAMRLYISRGVGLWASFPLRLGAPSEITLLTLHENAEKQETTRPQ